MPKHNQAWESLDVSSLLERRELLREQTISGGISGATTSVNVGRYTVPMGVPLRRQFPVGLPEYYRDVPQGYPQEYTDLLGMYGVR